MPLLSNKLYILNKIRKEKKDDELVFCHSLTNEICESEDELNRKTFLYNQKIWTCRITGQVNLTFKEALKSEQGCAKMLKNSFKKCFEAAVLQFVHHSKESLDTLIHKAWTQIHQEFCVNEPVTIKLTAPKELILKGIVVKVDRSKANEDKEQENSPIKLNSDASSSDKENIKKKIIPIKKNYFYSVKIFEMDKLVKDIPAETIDRTLRPPSKDQIRMFIRAHAIRHSGKQNYPWVVDDELVKKYRLPVLEPEFVTDKQKMRELSLFTEVQVYNKMREDSHQRADDEMLVDLTRSDDDDGDTKTAGVARRKTDTSIRDVRASGAGGKQKKKLKQATLFDVQTVSNATNQNCSGSGPPQRSSSIRSPLTSPTRSLPPLAQRLLKLVKETPSDPNVKQLVFKCCQLFSNQQISKFPDIIRSPIKARKEKLDEKKRIDSMSPEERDAYLTQKRNQLRQQLRERKREENAKLEDNEIEYTKQIPQGSPVPMEAGLSQDQWARIVSVSEFVRCYKRLLVPSGEFNSDDSGVIRVQELCRSVVGTSDDEHEVLSKLVCVLLKTLLQDNRVRNRREMGLCMTELPVTACTAGELLRLVLPLDNERRDFRNVDDTVDNDDNNNDDNTREAVDDVDDGNNNEVLTHNNNNKIAGPICEKLESQELHELSVEDKIAILELLQSRILELDIVSSFIDEYQREVCEAYKKKVVDTKELNDKLKVVRLNKQNMCRLTPMILANGTGVTNSDTAADLTALTNEESSQVVRRRQSIEQKLKESEEKERRLEKERQYQKLEKEEMLYKKSIEQCQKSYVTAISDAKQLMRVQPLGSDRHYRRYWHFSTAPGALYVEKELLSGAIDCGATSTAWTRFISPEELGELVDSLCEKGIRESSLRLELEAIMPKLREEMEAAALNDDTNGPLPVATKLAKTESFLVDGFKQELKETELSIRQGSLGGVEDYAEWQTSLDTATSMDDMKQALVAVFLGVHERFWNVPMKSANGRNEFLTAVEHARTQGRLNVLQSFLDACVCWSKSAKDDKCRVCRKNSDENAMLLCDSCNHAFHTFCLRPPLHEVPEGEWFCPHCKPVSRAKDTEGAAHNEAATAVTSSSTRDQANKQKSKTRQGTAANSEQCCVCQAPNADQLAKCTSCKKCFHAQCHEPPLRQIRRTNWHCCECRLDEAAVHKNRHSNNRLRHNGTTEEAEDDDEKERGDRDDDSDKETPPKVTKKKAGKKSATNSNSSSAKVNGVVKRKKPFHEVEPDDEEDEDMPQKRPRYAPNNCTKTDDIAADGKKSEQDESDVDTDNLSNLFSRRSSRKKKANTEDSANNEVVSSPPSASKRARNSHQGPEKIEKACQSMLKHLLNHKASWPFRDAVDPEEVPDYYQIVTNPMDLVRMMDKSKQGAYRDGVDALKQFIADIGQIFYNAELYNLPDSKIMGLASSLEDFFKTIYSKYDFGVEYSRMTDE